MKKLELLLAHIDRCPIDWMVDIDSTGGTLLLDSAATPKAIIAWLKRLDDIQAEVRVEVQRQAEQKAEQAERKEARRSRKGK